VCPRNCYARDGLIPSIKGRHSASEHSHLDRNDALCPGRVSHLLGAPNKLASDVRLGRLDGCRLYLASSDALEPLDRAGQSPSYNNASSVLDSQFSSRRGLNSWTRGLHIASTLPLVLLIQSVIAVLRQSQRQPLNLTSHSRNRDTSAVPKTISAWMFLRKRPRCFQTRHWGVSPPRP
jgi:hypothetical protein